MSCQVMTTSLGGDAEAFLPTLTNAFTLRARHESQIYWDPNSERVPTQCHVM